MADLGKYVIISGFLLIILGIILLFWDKIPFLGKLPGDIHIQRDNFHFFFPITTSIIISIIITIILWVINSLRK